MAIEKNILASNYKRLTVFQFYEFLAQTWLSGPWRHVLNYAGWNFSRQSKWNGIITYLPFFSNMQNICDIIIMNAENMRNEMIVTNLSVKENALCWHDFAV